MRVAVIGAGIAGLTAGFRLAQAGHECDVYERWPGLGGQVATLDLGDGALIERYYHHLFTSDREIVELYDEVGLGGDVDWYPSSVAVFADGASHAFTTPLDLLRFRPLSPAARLRMGLAVVALQRRGGGVERYEQITARRWIERAMGRQPWERVWGPMLRGKFGDRADDISMAWLWSKLTLRRKIKGAEARQERLGYPRGGWQPLLERLRDRIAERGGRVLIDRPAARIGRGPDGAGFELAAGGPDSFRRGHDPREFAPAGEPERYDAVVATVPSPIFEQLLEPGLRAEVGEEYLGMATSIEYHAARCLLLELDRPFSPSYWTNVADRSLPFIGLIEQTNLIDPARYGGRRLLYVANYVPAGDPLQALDLDGLIALYEPGLRRVSPGFTRDWIRRAWLFDEPAAQPIVTVGYQDRIPAMSTPAPGLYLANTTQIYPEDRGTNYSVRLGTQVAGLLGREV